MQLILHKRCKAITGKLSQHFTVQPVQLEDGTIQYHTRRTSPQPADPDREHLRFIRACARVASNDPHLAIADIRVTVQEILDALFEADYYAAMPWTDELRKVMQNVMLNYIQLGYKRLRRGQTLNARKTLKLLKYLELTDHKYEQQTLKMYKTNHESYGTHQVTDNQTTTPGAHALPPDQAAGRR